MQGHTHMAEKGWVPYTFQLTRTLAAGSTLESAQIPIGGDADFELHKLSRAWTGAGSAADWLTRLEDTGSGQNLSSDLIHGETIFGTGQRPFILAVPLLVRAAGAIKLDLQNLDGTNAITLYLSLHGLKRFV